ncbi:MAG TPA: shikimate dehydrogenase, partial [Rhodopila sp.]|nr:shikimate dehydrogenase [Rhodopila sp.]
MITGRGKVIAHIGYPTEAFKAPMIYNPWFEAKGIDAVVVPLGVKAEDFRDLLPALFRITT